VTYTQMCNERGGVESDLTFTCEDENSFYIVTPGASFQHDYVWMQKIIRQKGFDCSLQDITEHHGVLSIQGPKSRDVLSQLTDCDLSNDAFPFGTYKDVTVAGIANVRLQRLTFVGELGWEIHIPKNKASPIGFPRADASVNSNDDCVHVYDEILKTGQNYGLVNAGYSAIESLSLEKGYKHWHADVRVEDTPLECGTSFACKFKTDIDFCGRTALLKQKENGLKKRLAYVYPENKDIPVFGLETLYRDGVPCGFLRRGGYAYSLGQTVGVAYISDPDGGNVSPDWIRDGNYELEVMGEKV